MRSRQAAERDIKRGPPPRHLSKICSWAPRSREQRASLSRGWARDAEIAAVGFFERPDPRLAQIADPTPIGAMGRAIRRHGTAFAVCIVALLLSYSVNFGDRAARYGDDPRPNRRARAAGSGDDRPRPARHSAHPRAERARSLFCRRVRAGIGPALSTRSDAPLCLRPARGDPWVRRRWSSIACSAPSTSARSRRGSFALWRHAIVRRLWPSATASTRQPRRSRCRSSFASCSIIPRRGRRKIRSPFLSLPRSNLPTRGTRSLRAMRSGGIAGRAVLRRPFRSPMRLMT